MLRSSALVLRRLEQIVLRKAIASVPAVCSRRWAHWEFWPAWLFYLPVAAYYVWLASSLPQFHFAKRGQSRNSDRRTGRRIEMRNPRSVAARASERLVADAYLLEARPRATECVSLRQILSRSRPSTLPFILKPDFGQRGNGVRAGSFDGARRWIICDRSRAGDCAALRPGTAEVGIFYYRFPDESRGGSSPSRKRFFPRSLATAGARSRN